MKKFLILFNALSIGILFSSPAFSQKKFEGNWQGKLNVGVELRIVFHVKANADGSFSSTMDSPDQSAFGIACDSTQVTDNKIRMVLTKANIIYTGKLSGKENIKGTFTQGGKILPLDLKKTDKDEVEKYIRPQTPVPPFPYRSMDVEYDNTDKTLHFGATITIPQGKGPFPAIVMITGSGKQDRDESLFEHKPFAVIADRLTRSGYIVMRVDDRGAGKSTGDFANSTSEDFAKDVNTSIDYLKTTDGVDKNKIGLIGHSEGGMIAPMVATERDDINFIILLAGPGVKIVDLMAEQNAAILKSNGLNEDAVNSFKTAYAGIATKIIEAKDTSAAYTNALEYFNGWCSNANAATLRQLGFKDNEDREKYIHQLCATFNTPWFKYFMSFDPTPYLKKLKCKVLALNGSKDVQVIASQNLPGIEAALKKSNIKNYEVKELPGLNHLFQTCKTCTVNEYGKLEETFSPAALDIITEWLNKNVK